MPLYKSSQISQKMVPSALLVIKWELEVINWKKANFY